MELLEILFSYLEREAPDATKVWRQAMGMRVGLPDAKLHEIYYKAY